MTSGGTGERTPRSGDEDPAGPARSPRELTTATAPAPAAHSSSDSAPAAQGSRESFAAGHLRDTTGNYTVTNAEPDSGYLFLFAEFAFHAISSGIETGIWQPLLNPLVRIQELFKLAYAPNKDDCFQQTAPPPDHAPADQPTRDNIRNGYPPTLTNEQLAFQMGANLRAAFTSFC